MCVCISVKESDGRRVAEREKLAGVPEIADPRIGLILNPYFLPLFPIPLTVQYANTTCESYG